MGKFKKVSPSWEKEMNDFLNRAYSEVREERYKLPANLDQNFWDRKVESLKYQGNIIRSYS